MIEVPLRTIHLLFVAAAAGLPLYCIILDLRRSVDPAWSRAQRNMAIAATAGLLLGGLSGLLYGYVIWSRPLSSALESIGTRLPFGIVEYIFTLVIYLGYCATFVVQTDISPKFRIFRAIMLFVALTNLAYHFPTLLGVVRYLRDAGGGTPLNSTQFRGLAFSYSIVLGSIHFLLSALIVASLITTATFRSVKNSDRFLRSVSVTALTAMLGQWFTGIALYLEYPRHLQIELTFLWQWGGLPQLIGAAWVLTLCQIGLVVRPRSTGWWFAATFSLTILLIQMSWLGARG